MAPYVGGQVQPVPLYVAPRRLDIDRLIVALDDHVCHETGDKLVWVASLFCIRVGHEHFLPGRDPLLAFATPYLRYGSVKIYGRSLSLSNCPECGGKWPDRETFTEDWYAHNPELRRYVCEFCDTPNERHWHMRSTVSEEASLLMPHTSASRLAQEEADRAEDDEIDAAQDDVEAHLPRDGDDDETQALDDEDLLNLGSTS